jgi:hypothetical protein
MNDIRDTLEERGTRYGAFCDHAEICQELKDVMRDTPNWESLRPDQKEALEMIQHKIASDQLCQAGDRVRRKPDDHRASDHAQDLEARLKGDDE